MQLDNKVEVYVEIEKGSNIKYEYDKTVNELVIDRVLDAPFYYPYAYGFIPHTLAQDGDDLDILIITPDNHICRDAFYKVYIIGALKMEDEKGVDEKILCVLPEDYNDIQDISDLNPSILENIDWFFANYKKKTVDKWSKTHGFMNKKDAIKLYEMSRVYY